MQQMQQRRHAGFTLVEVMVALLIMALMSALAWRGLDALLGTRDGAQRHLDQTARLQAVMGQWERDLQSLQDSTVVPALGYDGATLSLTRRQPDGMQVVAWSLRDGGLYRWEGPIVRSAAELLQSYQRSQQLQSLPAGEQLRALDGVAGWQLYYFRNNSWSNALSSSGASSNSAAQAAAAASAAASGVVLQQNASALPSGVRMLLQFGEGSGFGGPLTREIAIDP